MKEYDDLGPEDVIQEGDEFELTNSHSEIYWAKASSVGARVKNFGGLKFRRPRKAAQGPCCLRKRPAKLVMSICADCADAFGETQIEPRKASGQETILQYERELEELRGQRDNLLCRIHRDGGHYIHDHGIEKALTDADEIAAKWNADNDSLRTKLDECARVMELAQAASKMVVQWVNQYDATDLEGHAIEEMKLHTVTEHVEHASAQLAATLKEVKGEG